jgi:hypothetical protein
VSELNAQDPLTTLAFVNGTRILPINRSVSFRCDGWFGVVAPGYSKDSRVHARVVIGQVGVGHMAKEIFEANRSIGFRKEFDSRSEGKQEVEARGLIDDQVSFREHNPGVDGGGWAETMAGKACHAKAQWSDSGCIRLLGSASYWIDGNYPAARVCHRAKICPDIDDTNYPGRDDVYYAVRECSHFS